MAQLAGVWSWIFAPFGLGPRRCLGESLAMTIVQIALTSLLVRCDFERVEAHPVQSTVVLSQRDRVGKFCYA